MAIEDRTVSFSEWLKERNENLQLRDYLGDKNRRIDQLEMQLKEKENIIALSKALTDRMSEKVTELEGQMTAICTLIALVTDQFIAVLDDLTQRVEPDVREQLLVTKKTMVASLSKLERYLRHNESNNTEGTTPS